jgi:hypothetical protein
MALFPNVADNHGAVVADAELRPVVLADADALAEAEHLRQPGDRGPDIGIDEHRDDGARRNRPVRLHEQ